MNGPPNRPENFGESFGENRRYPGFEPTHSERFVALMTKHYPGWREARAELNELPLAAEAWG